MLKRFSSSHPLLMDSIANAWLANGATGFSCWNGTEILAEWGHQSPDGFFLSQAISLDNEKIGELRVYGLESPGASARLSADVQLIASLLPLERDVHHLATELIETRDRLVAIYQLSQMNVESFDLEKTLDRIICEAVEILHAENAFLWVELNDQHQFKLYSPAPDLDETVVQDYLDKMEVETYRLIQYDHPLNGKEKAFDSLLLIPVQLHVNGVKNAAFGALRMGGAPFLSPEIKVAQVIAEYAGMQIENVLVSKQNLSLARIQTEMELARRVQVNLLPPQPSGIPGIDIDAFSASALQVGGDFYDFIEPPGGGLCFVVCDISGKGLPAALLMAMTRIAIRSELQQMLDLSPEHIVERTNYVLYDDFTKMGMFATLFIGLIDPESGCLQYANAGHSPVIFSPANSHPFILPADGPPVGVLPSSLSERKSLSMNPGDVILVGTDGLNESQNAQGKRFGLQRLLDTAEVLAHKPAGQIAQGIRKAISAFAEDVEPIDDQTLVVVRRITIPYREVKEAA